MILEMDLKRDFGEGELALQARIVLYVARTVLEAGRIACAGIRSYKALWTSTGRMLARAMLSKIDKKECGYQGIDC